MGGSDWRPYLFELVPAAVHALAMLTTAITPDARTTSLTASPSGPRLRPDAVTGAVVDVLVTSCIIAGVRWVGSWGSLRHPSTSIAIDRAIQGGIPPR